MKNITITVCYALLAIFVHSQIIPTLPAKPKPTVANTTPKTKLHTQDDNMVLVQGGTFYMGSKDGEADQKPVHPVTVSSFYISPNEVTVAQFRKFIQATGYTTTAEQNGKSWMWNDGKWELETGVTWQHDLASDRRSPDHDNEPVVHVSWDDCQRYCQWMGKQTGTTYRLPTEAEWEYAARGGNKSNGYIYSGSNNIDEVGWYQSNSGGKTHPVGMKKPNELGVYDMTGNVWEWCSDWYDKDYYSNSPAQNPQGPSTGSDLETRVNRGGSWTSTPQSCGAFRSYNGHLETYSDLGFRPVVSF